MTWIELLKRTKPGAVDEALYIDCPRSHFDEAKDLCDTDGDLTECQECWEQEVPPEVVKKYLPDDEGE